MTNILASLLDFESVSQHLAWVVRRWEQVETNRGPFFFFVYQAVCTVSIRSARHNFSE